VTGKGAARYYYDLTKDRHNIHPALTAGMLSQTDGALLLLRLVLHPILYFLHSRLMRLVA